jgi:hypothetical protein
MRTKTVYGTDEVPHLWAHQRTDHARNPQGNLYFHGKTIYSYGSHYPIAVISEKDSNTVLFNSNSSTNTTQGQKSSVRSAISHKTIIYCSNPVEAEHGDHDRNLKDFEYRAKEPANKIGKAKKPEKYFSEIESIRNEFLAYTGFFKIKFKKKDYPTVFMEPSPELIEQAKERVKREKVLQAQREAKALKLAENQLAWWKQNKTYRETGTSESNNLIPAPTGLKHTYLRIDTEGQIETSKGIELPMDVARRFYHWCRVMAKSGGCNGDCKKEILGYPVKVIDSEHIVIGCHDIQWTEINRIATLAGWIK